MTVRHRMLAVVRCGDASQHTSWAVGDCEFDVGVSYFGDNQGRSFPEARYVHRGKGGKWDGLFNFFSQFPETVDAYDYFWLPDDDIASTAADVNQLLAIGLTRNLQIFQPALDELSYYSHLITLRHPSFTLRYTNFVEIMVPVISKAILRRTLPMIQETRSGFGIDFIWPTLAAEITRSLNCGTAILDQVSVRHTRPVGGSLHEFMAKIGGKSVKEEITSALATVDSQRTAVINGVPVPRIRITSGIDNAGRPIHGVRLAANVAIDMVWRYTNKVQPVNKVAAIKHALKALRADPGS